MSEEGGGKIKNKRQVGQGKPYERRKSILGKVKDFITPSWLSSFVSTPSGQKQQAEKEYQRTDSDLPTNSFGTNSRVFHQNDVSRMPPVFVPLDKRNGTAGQMMGPPQSTVIAHTRPVEPRQECLPFQAGFTSSQLPLMPERVLDHHHHHMENDDNLSDRSDNSKSTSGCSSMIPHPPSTIQKDRVMLELNEVDLGNIKEKLVDTEDKKSKLGRSLTWTAQYNTKRPKKPASTDKPSFDVSLFGSPVAGMSGTISKDKLNESTFYPGRTSFGGASSHRRQNLNTTAPYMSSPFPVRQKMKAKSLNNTFSGSESTSGTAKRILATLEKMTTPLGDARKIPVDDTVMQNLSSSFSFTPSAYRRPTRHSIGGYLNSSRELQTQSKAPPLQKVSTPGSASIAANLQRFVPNQERKTTDATSSYQLPGSSYQEAPSSGSGKMKSKKFSQHVPAKKIEEEEEDQPYEIPNLKTDFQLPVKEMPSFNFNTPIPPYQPKVITPTSQSFKFSSPINKSPVASSYTPASPPKMEFKFSSPIQPNEGSSSPTKGKTVTFNLGNDNTPIRYNAKPATTTLFSGKSSQIPQGVSSPSVSSSTSNSPMGGGLKVASQLKTGSVMDILGKSSDKPTVSASPKKDGLSKFVAQGWTCDMCLVTNKDDSSKCLACATPKPGQNAVSSKKNTSSFPSFAAPSGWTCDMCLVTNKESDDKCAACTTAKPGLKKTLSTPAVSSFPTVKKPAGDWDCDICLVQNKGDSSKCIACETPRPGQQSTETAASGGFKVAAGAFSGNSGFVLPSGSSANTNSSNSGFKFGSQSTTGSGFKFGDKTVKPETNDKKEQKSDSSKDSSAIPSTGFKFGESSSKPASDISSFGSGFKFGENVSKASESPSKIKSESLLTEKNDKTSVGGFVFGRSSDSLQNSTDKVGALRSEKTVLLDSTNISVTTATKATTGFSFTSTKSDTATTTPGGFTFGGNSVSSEQKPTNGGFVFGQADSNKESSIKTTSVNSVFGGSDKTNSGNSLFGGDPKTTSVNSVLKNDSLNSFCGTNNSGFTAPKPQENTSEPTLSTNQISKVSPSLKRGRDDEGSVEAKKPFSLPSSGSIQFGVKSTASTTSASSSSGIFAFGQNKESKPESASSSSFNFTGAAASSSSAPMFNPVSRSSSLFSSPTSSKASSSMFGNSTSLTNSSAGTFVFGAGSSTPSTSTAFGATSQTSSIFGATTTTTASSFGNMNSTPSFGAASTVTNNGFGAGFGSSVNSFGTQPASTGSVFGAPATTTSSGFGSATPSFGASQTAAPVFGSSSAAPSFGTPSVSSAPSFGSAPQSNPFGAPAPSATSTVPGGFNFNSAPSFNFGQPSTAPTANASPAVFQFGGPKQAETPQQPATGGFNFGQSASAPAGAPFSFSATPAPAQAGFGGGFPQAPSTPQQSQNAMFTIGSSDNRKIKKAVRKIKR